MPEKNHPRNTKQQLGKILNYRDLTPQRKANYHFAFSKSPQPDFALHLQMPPALLHSTSPGGFPGQADGTEGALPTEILEEARRHGERGKKRGREIGQKRERELLWQYFYQAQISVRHVL